MANSDTFRSKDGSSVEDTNVSTGSELVKAIARMWNSDTSMRWFVLLGIAGSLAIGYKIVRIYLTGALMTAEVSDVTIVPRYVYPDGGGTYDPEHASVGLRDVPTRLNSYHWTPTPGSRVAILYSREMRDGYLVVPGDNFVDALNNSHPSGGIFVIFGLIFVIGIVAHLSWNLLHTCKDIWQASTDAIPATRPVLHVVGANVAAITDCLLAMTSVTLLLVATFALWLLVIRVERHGEAAIALIVLAPLAMLLSRAPIHLMHFLVRLRHNSGILMVVVRNLFACTAAVYALFTLVKYLLSGRLRDVNSLIEFGKSLLDVLT